MNNIQVDVICLIEKTGKVTPIKIRIENTDGSTITAKINEIVYRREDIYASFATLTYGCKVELDEAMQLIELKYNVHERIWRINKVIGR